MFPRSMLKLLLPLIFALVASGTENVPATRQLAGFRDKTKHPIGILTTAAGAPVEYREATNTLNTDILDNDHLIDMLQHVVRKLIPERIVHGPGAGAFGYFVTTHDISHITKAKLFSKVGKKTPVAVRFSPGFTRIGARDTLRESRGFGVKFYTEDGNYDLTLINQPVFAIKEPLLFSSLLNVLKRNPATNLPDHNMIWDFLTLHPEGLNQFLRILSQHGMPDGYRHMRGFGIHTMQLYNETGCSHFGRFFLYPEAGTKFLNRSQTIELASGDPDHFARDLYDSIASGNYPSWELKLQLIPECDVHNTDLGIFDITQELSYERYPLHSIGKMILNRNPTNNFADMEQLAFCPGNLVPGIVGSPDKIFHTRRFLYRDAQLYRLGSNFMRIPVNSPMKGPALTYNQDGVGPVNDNGNDGPIYFPNTFNGPVPYVDENRPTLIKVHEIAKANNFKDFVNFYENTLNSVDRSELVETVVEHMCSCVENIKKRTVKTLKMIHSSFGQRVAKGLAANCNNSR